MHLMHRCILGIDKSVLTLDAGAGKGTTSCTFHKVENRRCNHSRRVSNDAKYAEIQMNKQN